MAVTLTTHPVSGSDNIFAGFIPCNVVFKREDLVVVDTESGLDDNVLINVGTDLTSYLSLGDYVYLYSEGDSGLFTYNVSAAITAITATEITINSKFVEASTGGYINYLKNFYVEIECVGKENANRKIIPFSLRDNGDNAGNITIDLSIVNDLNSQAYAFTKREMIETRVEFNIQWRPVSLGSVPSYTLVDELIVLVYATVTPESETILNGFDIPKIYAGYPMGVVVAHSNGVAGATLEVKYNQLDINRQVITSGTTLGTLDAEFYGFLFWPLTGTISDSTEFIDFNLYGTQVFDFAAPDFATPDFLTE
jgi:hypothetical protein